MINPVLAFLYQKNLPVKRLEPFGLTIGRFSETESFIGFVHIFPVKQDDVNVFVLVFLDGEGVF
jgi:hypothetical protein